MKEYWVIRTVEEDGKKPKAEMWGLFFTYKQASEYVKSCSRERQKELVITEVERAIPSISKR